ncbi:MAG: hypothetical protein AB9882_10615 [Ignavibacteriaceae bacterium]
MNKLQVSESGKLVTTGNRSLTNMKRKFNALNDNIAMRAQEDEDINNRMKILKCKKKELTAKLDAELKDLKTRQKTTYRRETDAPGGTDSPAEYNRGIIERPQLAGHRGTRTNRD